MNEKKSASGNHATQNWMIQRITAILMLPMLTWFVIVSLKSLANPEFLIYQIISSPYYTVIIMLLILTALYHGMLGVIEIIEDYVHCSCVKICLIVGLKFLNIFVSMLGVLSLLILHLTSFIEG